MIGITVLFLIPIYYIARSKGYNALLVCIISGLIGCFTPFFLHYVRGQPLLPFADASIPFALLVVVWLLPKRKGAPGKAYLNIKFVCPECQKQVSFKRHKEGKAVLCTSCGEIITVPLDEYSYKHSDKKRACPPARDGKVCFDSYGNEVAAIEMQSFLEGHGIVAEIIDGTGGGALPQLGIVQGFKLLIDAQDWNKAVEIEENKNGMDFSLPNELQ